MKHGKHLQIPECPREVERLWAAASKIPADKMPEWLSPADASWYRLVCIAPEGGLTEQEIEDAEALRFVFEECDGEVHVFMPHPPIAPVYSIGIYSGAEPCSHARLDREA